MKMFYFKDKDGNELKFHINSNNELYLAAGQTDEYYNGYICLDKEDVDELIKSLKSILREM